LGPKRGHGSRRSSGFSGFLRYSGGHGFPIACDSHRKPPASPDVTTGTLSAIPENLRYDGGTQRLSSLQSRKCSSENADRRDPARGCRLAREVLL